MYASADGQKVLLQVCSSIHSVISQRAVLSKPITEPTVDKQNPNFPLEHATYACIPMMTEVQTAHPHARPIMPGAAVQHCNSSEGIDCTCQC